MKRYGSFYGMRIGDDDSFGTQGKDLSLCPDLEEATCHTAVHRPKICESDVQSDEEI